MFPDEEIERAARQLAQYRQDNALSNILDKYSELLVDYRRLKSDYEEERDSRERYKQMAKGQERDPFVLVLVDGDGYVFNDSHVAKGADGGSSAAQALNDAVGFSLRAKGLQHCQIMVRIYANVSGLSKALSKAGLAGPEKRSLAPFIASFNRSYGLADFVDAGELKENADFKLRSLLRLHAESAQCKHIYFAACHDVGYISELTPHTGNRGKFTLVNSPGIRFHSEFTKLDMAIEEFHGVFRSTQLDASASYRAPLRPGPANVKASLSPIEQGSSFGPAGGTDKKVCRFNTQGKCKYGKSCKHLHVEDRSSSSTTWRSTSIFGSHPAEEASSTNGQYLDKSAQKIRSPGFLNVSQLPKKKDIPNGHVAVNDNGFRLDPYIQPPSPKTTSQLMARIKQRPVCNKLHLTGLCEAGDKCIYDHGPLDAESKSALESLARSLPCTKRGICRNGLCTKGHICQNQHCKYYGGRAMCKLPYLSHDEGLVLAEYVPAITIGGPYTLLRPNGGSSTRASSVYGDDPQRLGSPQVPEEEDDERRMSLGGMSGALVETDSDVSNGHGGLSVNLSL